MLTIAVLRGASARVDYLFYAGLRDHERRGVWLGRACRAAAVEQGGPVEPADLLLLLEGYTPEFRTRLQHHRKGYPARIAGWDFTFSVSKDLSLAAAIEGEPLAEDIRDAFRDALSDLFPVIEHMLAPNSAQPQPDDAEETPALGALFFHVTSRHNDPHLHAHLIVPNGCLIRQDDGTLAWRAVDPIRPFLGSQDLDRLVQSEVARRLQAKGYPVELDADGRAHLPAISAELCARYSRGKAALLAAEAEERAAPNGRPLARKVAKGRSLINTRIRPDKPAEAKATNLSKQDAEHLRETMRRLSRQKSRRVRPMLPYDRIYRRKLEKEAEEACQRQQDLDVGRTVVARALRSMASRNRHTPIGALLDAVLTFIRLAEMRRRQRDAFLGFRDDESMSIATRTKARAFTFATALTSTDGLHADTRETKRRHR